MAYPRDPERCEKFATFLEREITAANYKTQYEFANAAELSTASVSRMINKTQLPDIATLKKMAPVLKKTLHELMVAAGYLDSNESSVDDQGPAA